MRSLVRGRKHSLASKYLRVNMYAAGGAMCYKAVNWYIYAFLSLCSLSLTKLGSLGANDPAISSSWQNVRVKCRRRYKRGEMMVIV
jgi:hypothetical protein